MEGNEDCDREMMRAIQLTIALIIVLLSRPRGTVHTVLLVECVLWLLPQVHRLSVEVKSNMVDQTARKACAGWLPII